MDKRFQEAQQELIRSLYGREDTPPRWKFCVSYANGNLGQSVGSLFVKKYFDEQSKADVSLNKAVYFSEMEIIPFVFMDVARSQHTPFLLSKFCKITDFHTKSFLKYQYLWDPA